MIEILEYISIIAPGLTSVICIIIGALTTISRLRAQIMEFKSDKNALMEELKKSDNNYKLQIQQLIEQNKELGEINKILTDRLSRTKGYTNATIGVKYGKNEKA